MLTNNIEIKGFVSVLSVNSVNSEQIAKLRKCQESNNWLDFGPWDASNTLIAIHNEFVYVVENNRDNPPDTSRQY